MVKMMYKEQGSITVFMSLVMLLIMSILCVQVQAVAINTGMYMVDKAHSAAQKAVMSNYCKEIYDNYHIFTVDLEAEDMEGKLVDYVKASINPSIKYTGKAYSSVNLSGVNFVDATDVDFEKITEQDGKLFIDEVVQYMKFHLEDDFAKEYLEKFTPFNKTDNVSKVVEKKQEIYDKALNVSSNVLKLMGYVDGIGVGNGEVKYDSNGYIKIEKYYAKILVHNSDMNELGINNEELYMLLKDKCYIITNEIELLEEEYLEYGNAVKKNKNISKLKKSCSKHRKELLKIIEESLDYHEKAISIIDKIYEENSKYEDAKKEFGLYLDSVKGEIPQNIYIQLKDDNQKKENKNILEDLPQIKSQLMKNKNILIELKEIGDIKFGKDEDDFVRGQAILKKMLDCSKDYSVEKISFDYKGLKIKKDKTNYFQSAKSVIDNGVIGLVTSEDKLSKNRLEEATLPSGELSEESVLGIGGAIASGATSGIEEAISSFSTITTLMSQGFNGVTQMLEEGSDNALDKIFLCEYINQNFNCYGVVGSDVSSDLQHALEYEKEYLICGNSTDMANLRSIVNKILVIRTVCNFISLFTDSGKNAQAMEVASLAFGFTGVPAIVEAAKILIMFMWAYEESLVDMYALLDGSGVPLIKTGNQILLSMEELPLLSKSLIMQKAKNYKNSSIVASVTYDLYLNLFMVMSDESKLAYRCMDLIQGNINKTYEKNINLKRCAYGMSSTVNVSFDMKYVAYDFMEKIIPNISQIRGYSSKKAYCY